MPEIEISAEQRDYLDDLRADLEDRHVGEYGAVRPRDALQFLIDRYESGEATVADAGAPGPADSEEGDTGEIEGGDAGEVEGGDAGETGSEDDDRLQSMMQLLDEHDDKWEEVDADDGKYAVTLPGGETEHVRTKDDVRALLFRHY